MNALALHRTFEECDGERWPVYQWGGLELRDFTGWTWRGQSFIATTTDNPLTGGCFLELTDAVVSLDLFESDLPNPLNSTGCLEWWADREPGHLMGLEIKEDGTLWAEVWTGAVDVWGMSHHVSGPPQALLEGWQVVQVTLNGARYVTPRTIMVGPVGTVAELQPGEDKSGSFDADFWRKALR